MVTVDIRKEDRTRADTIRAMLEVCRYMQKTYPLGVYIWHSLPDTAPIQR